MERKMERFQELFFLHFDKDTRDDWFMLRPQRGRGMVATVIDRRTLSQMSLESLMYHEEVDPVERKIARDFFKFKLHQLGQITWAGRCAPPGAVLPKPFKPIVRPRNYHTPSEWKVKRDTLFEFVNQPIMKFWNVDGFVIRWKNFKKWITKATGLVSIWHIPVHHCRGNDYHPRRGYVDLTRKNYFYEWDTPRIKIQRNTDRYQEFLESWMNEVVLRRAHIQKRKMQYKYEYVQLTMYPAWCKDHINLIRKMFVQYDPMLTGHVTLEEMFELLDTYGDTTSRMTQAAYFNHFVKSGEPPDNMIEFEEFLRVLYCLTVDPPKDKPSTDPDAVIKIPVEDIMMGNHRRTEYYAIRMAFQDYYERLFSSCL